MGRVTRRRFLSDLARYGACPAVAAAWLDRSASRAQDVLPEIPPAASRPTTAMVDPALISRIAHVREPRVLDGSRIHLRLLQEMIENALTLATQIADPAEAWNHLLARDEVIAVKFNHVGADELRTTVPFAQALIASLQRADIEPDRLMLVEAPDVLEIRELKTRSVPYGFSGPPRDFGSGVEELTAVLDEATAIINIPFLKTHNIAGLTGCLKNLSHALIRRPGRYHANACAPYVGDIVALPEIRDKLRVHIVNALRIVHHDGPRVRPGNTLQHGAVIAGTDPLALDAFGLDILNDYRERAGLPHVARSGAEIPSLASAIRHRLGTLDPDYMRVLVPDRY